MVAPSLLKTWLKASRPASQLYICVPLIVGQLYAQSAGYALSPWIVFWVQLFGVSIQLYIVYANDYADFATDQINRTYTLYSGGSRVLVDGEIRHTSLGRAAVMAALVSIGTGLALGVLWGRWFSLVLVLAALALLHLYSYWPARLNYRGGGEILQMIGTGIVLPLFGWYAQTGTLVGFPIWPVVSILPSLLACAVSTSLPDEISDRESQKRSAAVLLGQRLAQTMVIVLHTVSVLLLLWMSEMGRQAMFAILILFALSAILGQLLLFGGRPGQSRLFWFGIYSIASTLVITLASAAGRPPV